MVFWTPWVGPPQYVLAWTETGPTQGPPQEMHRLKLMIREEIMPQDELPSFPALAHLAESGFLAPDAWNCRKLQVSLKVAIDVPMLGTIIETNGDNLDDSHMPIGWPLLIDGAVRQFCEAGPTPFVRRGWARYEFCVHRYSTVQDMQDRLSAYDLSKNSVEINKDAPQWTHFSVWNRKYMEPLPGNDLRSMWQACEPAIGRKIAASYDIRVHDIRRCVDFVNTLPPRSVPESPFFLRTRHACTATMPSSQLHLSATNQGRGSAHPVWKQGSCHHPTNASRQASPYS